MRWWQILVLTLDLYIVVSIGPWMLLQIIEWSLNKSRHSLANLSARLNELRAAAAEVAGWPQQPRAGRYEAPDRLARQGLDALRDDLEAIKGLWPSLSLYIPARIGPLDVVLLRSWGPLIKDLGTWREARAMRQRLEHAETALAVVQEQKRIVNEIPAKTRARLTETRAELQRLGALLDMELDLGTRGLEDMAQRLRALSEDVQQAIESLSQAAPIDLPSVVLRIDALLSEAGPATEALDGQLVDAVRERNSAQSQVPRMRASLAAAAKHWEGLMARGATEPLIAERLQGATARFEKLAAVVEERSLDAYRHVNAELATLDGELQETNDLLAVLSELMTEAKAAVEGDVQELARVQAQCAELAARETALEDDVTQHLLEQGGDAYREAESCAALGTIEGCERAISLSVTAMRCLKEAELSAARLEEQAQELRAYSVTIYGEPLAAQRQRAAKVREQLQLYARHWDGGLSRRVEVALDRLQRVEATVHALTPGLGLQRRLPQSELPQVIATLEGARGEFEDAATAIDRLEAEAERLHGLRAKLEDALVELTTERLPALAETSRRMLPDHRARLAALVDVLRVEIPQLEDPTEVDYDEAFGVWLPNALRSLAEVERAHQQSVRGYREALNGTMQALDREWGRLQKLQPHNYYRIEENVDRLAADLDAWRVDAQNHLDDPQVLHELLGRRVAVLQDRIKTARTQLENGRANLEGLDKHLHKLAQSIRGLRGQIQERQRTSRFKGIPWEQTEADGAWGRAQDLEQDSRTASSLVDAIDLMQRAVNAAAEAEQLYSRAQHQMGAALDRLDDEMRSISIAMGRAQRRARELRENGAAEEAEGIQAVCLDGQQAAERAESATSFDEALKRLRGARNALARL